MAAAGHGVQATGAFSYLLSEDYQKIFFDDYAHTPEQFSKVAKLMQMNASDWKEAVLAGFGRAPVINEGNPVTFDYLKQGYPKTVTPTKYGLGFQITEEMHDDDLTGHMKKAPAILAKSMAWAREYQYWSLFNDGDDTHTSADGQYIFATAHPGLRTATGTQGNTPSSAGSLSLTTYEAALLQFMKWVDEAGYPIDYSPYLLVIPPDLVWVARELQLSEHKPYTADNEINPVNVEEHSGMSYMVCRWLTSTTAWYIISRNHDLRFMWRKKVQFQSGDDFSSGNALFKSTMRFATACYDWRGAYMNAGA
jgi:hypothetical protein